MAGEEFLLIAVLIVVGIFLTVGIYASRYKRVPTDQAMVVYGNKKGDVGFTIVGGGGGKFIIPIKESYKFMSLEVQTLLIRVQDVITRSGVPVTVDCVAQIKISSEKTKLNVAAQQLLNKPTNEISGMAEQTITGHVRGVCATLEVEGINSDRDALSSKIREVAVPDLGNMGLEIVSLTVKDIADQVGYLEALGKRRTAEVKRDAIIGESAARRDAIMQSAEYDKQGQQARFEADASIAAAQRDRDVKVNQYQSQVEMERANKEIAFDLQDRIRRQELVQAEVQIQIKEKEKQIDLQQKEIERKTKEVESVIRVPAKAEADRLATIAEGDQRATVARATGDAQATFARGKAQADVIQVQGEANANIIREMAQPLAGTDKLIMMGGAGGPAGLVENVAQGALKASAMLESMTGVSLGQLVRGVAGGAGGGMGRLAALATDAGIDVTKLTNLLGKLSDDEVRNILRNLSAAGELVDDVAKEGKGKK